MKKVLRPHTVEFKHPVDLKNSVITPINVVVESIHDNNVLNLPGDILEIGTFCGGFTTILSRLAKPHGKHVYTIEEASP